MIVRTILANKVGEVATMLPDQPVMDAAMLLASRQIGVVVVTTADNMVLGILSERDIVRRLAEAGARVLDAPVRTVMTTDVAICSPDEPLDVIMRRMTTGGFRHLPAVSAGRLLGVISMGDVVKYNLDQMEYVSRELNGYMLTA
ncbi:CBS domain-containing protein [Blastochloris viridis]|uniref:CBS domain protein n=1 Tax=Blastochloris viridis TaxID=1079 RepID=A0A0H5BQC8_BLAVI|nr:CBS domain-containing protein [Blastochloris viridis]ALK09397.1 inosine 5'-monophosphate dehydrogenase [Blastochloris viridis]BAS00724.1 CBS domain protein [Blastochloris viridis]CUU42060.1 putative manganese-dependent inorganic pyrophosphatase [Blastochloris viridis]